MRQNITCQAEVEPFHVKFSDGVNLGSDLQRCIHQILGPNLKVEVVEVLRWGVEEAQNQHLEQCPVEEIELPLPPPQPCTADNIGHMLHNRHKLRTGLGHQLHHNIERTGRRSQLQLLDFRHQVLKE